MELSKAMLAMEREGKDNRTEKVSVGENNNAAAKAAETIIISTTIKTKNKREEKKKRAKKRMADEPCTQGFEVATFALEPEEATVNADAPNENVGYRKPTDRDPVSEFVLEKKEPPSYWVWTAPAASVAVLFVALGYYLAFVRE